MKKKTIKTNPLPYSDQNLLNINNCDIKSNSYPVYSEEGTLLAIISDVEGLPTEKRKKEE